MMMTAAILRQGGLPKPFSESRPLTVEEVELQAPGEGEVLVEIKAAGLCHSDLSAIEGIRPRKLPAIPGHEAAGVVRELGANVRNLAVGDHVVAVVVTTCGHCEYCYDGRPNLCDATKSSRANGTLQSGARRLRFRGEELNHYSGLSVFAQYAVCAASSLVAIDKEIPFEIAALFGCAVVTGVGAVLNTAQIGAGTSAVVVGLGGVGLSALAGAAAAGAYPIVAVDVQSVKLELARALGATHTVLASDLDAVEQVREITAGGARHVFEMAGHPAALESALKMTRKGGVTVTAGLPDVRTAIPLAIAHFVTDERTIKGSYMGSCVPQRDIPKYMRLFLEGRLPVNKLFSGTIGFGELNQAFDDLAGGQIVRKVLDPFR